jgi:hypothetical protein
MKKLTIIFCLILTITCNGKLLNRTKSWYDLEVMIPTCEESLKCSGIYYATHQFTLGKDTMINGNTYYALLDTTYGTALDHSFDYVREDTITGKVYFLIYDKYEKSEILLYDFNLKVNDQFAVVNNRSIYDSHSQDTINRFTVTGIDSMIYEGELRKTITFNNNLEWIEGIGSVYGLIYEYHSVGFYDDYFSRLLLCCTDNNLSKYKNVHGFDCIYTGPGEQVKELEDRSLKIFPNPVVNGTLNIRSNHSIKRVEVFNICGVSKGLYFPESNTYNLKMNNLTEGIYLLKVNDTFRKVLIK